MIDDKLNKCMQEIEMISRSQENIEIFDCLLYCRITETHYFY